MQYAERFIKPSDTPYRSKYLADDSRNYFGRFMEAKYNAPVANVPATEGDTTGNEETGPNPVGPA